MAYQYTGVQGRYSSLGFSAAYRSSGMRGMQEGVSQHGLPSRLMPKDHRGIHYKVTNTSLQQLHALSGIVQHTLSVLLAHADGPISLAGHVMQL